MSTATISWICFFFLWTAGSLDEVEDSEEDSHDCSDVEVDGLGEGSGSHVGLGEGLPMSSSFGI